MQDWTLDDDVPYLERPHEYDGQDRASIGMWSSAGNRTEQLAVLEEWIEFLRTPRPIVQLHLSGWSNDRMVRALAAQTNLVDLRIEGGRYSDLSVVGSLRQLEMLHVGWATSLTDLTPLISLGRVHTLRVEGGARLRDFAPLGALTALRDLQIGVATEDKTSVDSLEFVRHLRGLRSFSWMPGVAGNDYSPLLSLRDTEEIEVRELRGMRPSIHELADALPGLARTLAAAAAAAAEGENDAPFTWDVEDDDDDASWQVDTLRGPIAGTVFRTFTRTARTRSEHFWMRLDSPALDMSTPPPVERLVDRCAFAGDAAGPLLIWDTPVPRVARAAVDEWFEGNVDRWVPAPRPVTRDATALVPLADDEFWPHLEMFNGRFDGVMVQYRFDRELAARGEEFVLRWTQTLGLLSLRALPVAREIIASDRTLHGYALSVVGSLIGRGRANYEKWLADPASWTRPPHLDMASSVVFLGQGVLTHHREQIDIVTAFSPEIERERDSHQMAGFLTERDEEEYVNLSAARAVVRVDGVDRERIVAFDITAIDEDHREAAAKAAMLAFGGTVIAGPELSTASADWDRGFGRVFTVRRRSSSTDDDYIARYAGG